MRTDRIQSVPSSIFRNSRQYLHSNELFHRAMNDGGYSSSGNQTKHNNHQSNKRNNSSKTVVNRTSKGILMKGLFIDCNEILQTQNQLMKRAAIITEARNKTNYIKSYRSSI